MYSRLAGKIMVKQKIIPVYIRAACTLPITLTLLHSERPKLHRVLALLSAIGLTSKICIDGDADTATYAYTKVTTIELPVLLYRQAKNLLLSCLLIVFFFFFFFFYMNQLSDMAPVTDKHASFSANQVYQAASQSLN